MSKTLPLALCALALSAAAVPAAEIRLRERDHESLGKLISEYFEAKLESSGISEAKEKLADSIEKLEKKAKGESVLAWVEDLEQAFYFSRKYKNSVTKGRLSEESFEGYYGGIDYAVHAPKSYKADKGPYALLICLPDAEQTFQQQYDEDWMSPELRDEVILVLCGMPESQDTWDSLEGGIGNVLQVLRVVRDEYAVDPDRVFVAGRGASIPTAMRVGEMFPHVFAGIVGRAGDVPEGLSPTNFRNLPTFFAGGGANCTAFEKAAQEDGIETCTLAPDGTEADVLAWLLERPRRANPEHVSLAPTTRTGKAAYWLEVVGFDPADGPRIDARASRETNRVEIEATDVSSVQLYFNDLLVDMDEPIHVVVNGEEHELRLPRRLDFALDQAFKSGDSGRIYTNSYLFDVAATE